jgi:glucose-6-phosphate dehydrogenase assembly protein OpcA
MSRNTAPLGERTHTNIHDIERQLNDLWREATADHPDAVTRVCVLNLLIVAADPDAVERAGEVVAKLTMRFPNRAIVIQAEPAGEDLLDAWVQANCHLPAPGRPQVCCEQITILARGPAVARVPGTVLPLLAPDVPVALWWPRGEPFDDPLFARLGGIANRVIVDSASFARPGAGLERLAARLGGNGPAISDMSWGRLTPWRELVAQFFDAPAMVPHLYEAQRLTIDYTAPQDDALEQPVLLLMLGWLASRLGWQRAGAPESGPGRVSFALRRADGAPLAAAFRWVAPGSPEAGRAPVVVLECARARFEVARVAGTLDAGEVRADIGGLRPIQRIVRLETRDDAALIGEELQLFGRDQGFEAALRAACELRK